MIAKVLKFKQKKRGNRQESNDKASDQNLSDAPVTKIKTKYQIFEEACGDVLIEWQNYATKNRLNEYILSRLPSFSAVDYSVDFVNDLNLLSAVEQKLGVSVAIFYPGCTLTNPNGWTVAFYYDGEEYKMPVSMPSEASARALNLMFFQAFKVRVKR